MLGEDYTKDLAARLPRKENAHQADTLAMEGAHQS